VPSTSEQYSESRKLLRFVVTSQGIKVDPNKVKTIQVMPVVKVGKIFYLLSRV
jgi:hypothetical protein